MAKYISHSYLLHQGTVIGPDKEVELTEKQAKRLGEKVSAVKGEDKGPTVAELKVKAEELGVDGFGNMKKDELIKAIEEKQKAEA